VSRVKGWGPMMYDIALEYAGKKGVIPDRGEVSADAVRIWAHYLRSRSDVDKFPMDDDIGHSLGLRYDPDKCGQWDDWGGPRESLDYRYLKLRPTTISALKARGAWIEGGAPQTPDILGGDVSDQEWDEYEDRMNKRVARRWLRASVKYVQTVPVRTTVDVRQVAPRRPVLAEEPIVQVRGVIDLSPDPTKHELPVWFDAEVQVFADGTAEILTFAPTYGTLHGIQGDNLLGMYEHAFGRSLVNTKLKIIGIRK